MAKQRGISSTARAVAKLKRMLFKASRPSARRWIGVAVLALLLAQWTALGHAFSHASWRSPTAVAQADDAHGWSHSAGSSACQLVDQLLVGQATGGDPPVLCVVLTGATAAPLAPSRAPAQRPLAAYDARGPPRA
jgi:hypothetical protein